MIWMIISGFVFAAAAPFIFKLIPNATGKLLSLLPLSYFVYLLGFIPAVSEGNSMMFSYTWFASMGINQHFVVDGLSLTFGLIISGIGSIILFYASGYLHGHPKEARFYGYLLFFMTSMLGVVLSDNIISLFIFWELTSISSYLLIGFNHESERSRYAALQALLITGGGGLALMAGLIMMGSAAGSYSLSGLLANAELIKNSPLFIPILLLVLAGAFTKSAQFPFHFWLPNAMEAPTPVSAYLHSATMVKAGVFLLARLNPVFSGHDLWHTSLLLAGGITMLMGAAMATGQTDLKRILAYTTVSALGIMVFLIGLGGAYAITAAISFILVHAMYKGGLFLVAGAIDHETGTRNITQLGGLRIKLPYVFAGAMLAALSYAGIPPFLGFIGKELIYEATAHSSMAAIAFTVLALLTNMFLVATAMLVVVKPFFGTFKPTPKHPHHAPVSLWLGPALLGGAGLIFGLFPHWISQALVQPTVAGISQFEPVKLALWHGFTPLLLLSLLTLAGGIGVYYFSATLRKNIATFDAIAAYGPEEVYKKMLKGLINFSYRETHFFQDGYLRHYFYWILAVFIGLIVSALWFTGLLAEVSMDLSDIYFHEVMIVAIMLMAAYKAIIATSVLSSVAAMGLVGFGTALIYAMFSAPDLALTQFSIEVLTVLMLVFIVYNVPKFARISPKRNLMRDAVISIASGATVTILVLLVLKMPAESKISNFYLENSYVLAHGRNVVNVILVDFRGLDTMGEITVLSLAAIGVYSFLRLTTFKKKKA